MLDREKIRDYFGGSELSTDVWISKYRYEGEQTPDDMHRRLAKEFYRIEKNYVDKRPEQAKLKMSSYGYNREDLTEEKIYNLFKGFKYIIPGGSVNAILGTPIISSLSNCFLGDLPEDNYRSIMNVRTQQTSISKYRGGFGTSLELLRPRGAKVNNSAKTSTGSASFMEGFSTINNEIAQGGRRAALMLSHHINHPDAEEFILAKQDLTKVTGANISIKVTDEFVNAVKNGEEIYVQTYPVDRSKYNEIVPEDLGEFEYNKLYLGKKENTYYKVVNPKVLWHILMRCAHNTADPGILFEDRFIRYSPDGVYPEHRFRGTNPCGEVPLPPLDSCRLMSIVLSNYVDNPFTSSASFNEEKFYCDVYELGRLIDNLVDLEAEAVQKIIDKNLSDYNRNNEEESLEEAKLWGRILDKGLSGRRTGQGITALGDCLAYLGIKYDSDEALKTIEHIMRIFFKASLDCTIDMAIERGTFPTYSKAIEEGGNEWYSFVKENFPEDYNRLLTYGRRNVSTGSVAPQGSGSLMTMTTSGIEPVFLAYYERKRKVTQTDTDYDVIDEVGEKYKVYVVTHPGLKKFASIKYPDIDTDKLKIEEWEKIYKESPYYKSCSHDLNWRKRLDIQSIVQKYIGMSISITINLHKETKLEEISELYMYAWEKGCKGTTIYRDGSRTGVLNTIGNSGNNAGKPSDSKPTKRPKELIADLHNVKVKGEEFSVVVGLIDGKPYEVFAFRPTTNMPKRVTSGKIVKVLKGKYEFESEGLVEKLMLTSDSIEEKATTIYTSMLLRHSVPLNYVVKTTKKVNDNMLSFSSALCRVLSKYIKDGEASGESCPECGGKLVFEDGCKHCKDCGFSACG